MRCRFCGISFLDHVLDCEWKAREHARRIARVEMQDVPTETNEAGMSGHVPRGRRCNFCREVLPQHSSACIFFREVKDMLGPKEEPLMEQKIKDIVSPDAPTETNEAGGSQSQINVRFDLIDAKALFEMAKVLDHGAKKYGANNWRLIPVVDHLNHLLTHVYAYLAGDTSDDHLSHALCRATFALGVELADEDETPIPVVHFDPAYMEMGGKTDAFEYCSLKIRHQEHTIEGDESGSTWKYHCPGVE